MEDRVYPQVQVQFEAKVTNLRTKQSGMGRTCDISASELSLVLPIALVMGDDVQIEMADSVLFGRVACSKPEGPQFRSRIEVQRVQFGTSSLANLLQRTLLSNLPGVEYADLS